MFRHVRNSNANWWLEIVPHLNAVLAAKAIVVGLLVVVVVLCITREPVCMVEWKLLGNYRMRH